MIKYHNPQEFIKKYFHFPRFNLSVYFQRPNSVKRYGIISFELKKRETEECAVNRYCNLFREEDETKMGLLLLIVSMIFMNEGILTEGQCSFSLAR